jgi:transposase-like protein
MKQMKYSLQDMRADFPTDDACLEWLKDYLYPEGIFCKKCDKITPHHRMRTRKSYSCETCGHHVHPTAGTIFHKSSTPLTLWFEAIYLMTATRAGISAKQLERTLGITYKCAWRMFHQIRKMMADDGELISGETEVYETYIGRDPLKRRSTGKPRDSQIVFGMVERGGKVKTKHVKSAGARILQPEIQQGINAGSTVYSDEWSAYKKLPKMGYEHKTVNHRSGVYVSGITHTQNIENFWSHLKRGIRGVYRHVDPKYLQAYTDEYAFRYSHRNDFQPMFLALIGKVDKR